MKTYITTLYNKSTGHYSVPIIFETKEQAITTFINEVKMPDSHLINIKDNISIYCVGRFEHTTGKVTPYLFKKLLISGTEVITSPTSKKVEDSSFSEPTQFDIAFGGCQPTSKKGE